MLLRPREEQTGCREWLYHCLASSFDNSGKLTEVTTSKVSVAHPWKPTRERDILSWTAKSSWRDTRMSPSFIAANPVLLLQSTHQGTVGHRTVSNNILQGALKTTEINLKKACAWPAPQDNWNWESKSTRRVSHIRQVYIWAFSQPCFSEMLL